MGLFVVGRLAARHGVRVRLRHAQSGGLTALIWLPESVAAPESAQPLGRLRKFEADDYGPAPSLSAPTPAGGAGAFGGPFGLPGGGPGSGGNGGNAGPGAPFGTSPSQAAAAAARIPRFSGPANSGGNGGNGNGASFPAFGNGGAGATGTNGAAGSDTADAPGGPLPTRQPGGNGMQPGGGNPANGGGSAFSGSDFGGNDFGGNDFGAARIPSFGSDGGSAGTGPLPTLGGPGGTGPSTTTNGATGSDGSQVTVPPSVGNGQDQRLPIFDSLESDWFRRSGTSLSSGTEPAATQTWNSPADEGWRAARVAAAPEAGETTTAGLPKRVPRANLVPGSVGGGDDNEVAPPVRSADTVRNRMASFQRGVREARSAAPENEEP
jgi:hypothetical protein